MPLMGPQFVAEHTPRRAGKRLLERARPYLSAVPAMACVALFAVSRSLGHDGHFAGSMLALLGSLVCAVWQLYLLGS